MEECPHKLMCVHDQEDFIAIVLCVTCRGRTVTKVKWILCMWKNFMAWPILKCFLRPWYSDLMEGLKSGLYGRYIVVIRNMAKYGFPRSYRLWGRCTGRKAVVGEKSYSDEHKHLRNEYLKARAVSLKVVKKAKRDHQKRSSEQLERELGCPQKVWRALK